MPVDAEYLQNMARKLELQRQLVRKREQQKFERRLREFSSLSVEFVDWGAAEAVSANTRGRWTEAYVFPKYLGLGERSIEVEGECGAFLNSLSQFFLELPNEWIFLFAYEWRERGVYITDTHGFFGSLTELLPVIDDDFGIYSHDLSKSFIMLVDRRSDRLEALRIAVDGTLWSGIADLSPEGAKVMENSRDRPGSTDAKA